MRVDKLFYLNPRNNVSKYTDYINYIDTSSVNLGRLDDVTLLTEDFPSRAQRKVLHGDILYSTVRPNLRHYHLYTSSFDHVVASTGFVLLRKKEENTNEKFVYYFLSTNSVVDYLTNIAELSQATFPSFSPKDIGRIELPNFTLPAQRKIAGILSAYDELIENNNKRIKILERMVENLYREWFVRFRFPGHENTPIVEGLPKSWKIVRYSQVCSIVAGGDYPNDYYDKQTVEYNVPIYSNGIINNGLYGFCKIAQVKEPAITISARGTVGFVALRLKPFLPIVRLLAIIPREFSVYYLYFYAKMAKMEGNGTSQQQLTKPMLNKRKVLLPDPHSLKLFDKHVVPIFEEIENLKLQCQILANQRDELLPRLMSGKLVVKTEI